MKVNFQRPTRCCIPEYRTLHSHHRQEPNILHYKTWMYNDSPSIHFGVKVHNRYSSNMCTSCHCNAAYKPKGTAKTKCIWTVYTNQVYNSRHETSKSFPWNTTLTVLKMTSQVQTTKSVMWFNESMFVVRVQKRFHTAFGRDPIQNRIQLHEI
jgi:hypothetical protein